MKKLLVILSFLLLSIVSYASDSRPVAMIFPATADKNTSSVFATEMTQAIKLYLRQTGRADIVEFDKDSPLVQRAIHEHELDAAQLTSLTTADAKVKVASKLGADLAVYGDIAIENTKLTITVYFAATHSKKTWKKDSTVQISGTEDHERATLNTIQTSTSDVIIRLVAEALKDVKANQAASQVPVADESTMALVPEIDQPVFKTPEDKVGTHIGKADDYLKEGDEASAIVEYRRAINADPKSVDLRMRLIRIYIRRKMFDEAANELERARAIDPDNDDLRAELADVYDQSGAPERAAQIFADQAEKNPKDVAARLKVGDHYWLHGQMELAEKQYRLAIKTDPNSPSPHERLALVLASQSLYNDARAEMVKLHQLKQDQDNGSISELYGRFRSIVDKDINDVVGQLETSLKAFEDKQVTREVCYDNVRSLGTRIDSVGGFLQELNPPDVESFRHRRRVLGCSLVSQACASTLLYLETNKTSDQDDAAIFLSEAKQQFSMQ